MKRQIMTPFKAPRKAGGKQKKTEQQTILETEEPTELGLIWPQSAVTDVISEPSNPWWPEDTLGGNDVNEPIGKGKDVMEESPRLTDYESEGFVARRIERTTPQKFSDGFRLLELARRKQKEDTALQRAKADLQAKDKTLRIALGELANAKLDLEKTATSESEEDNVPIVALVGKKRRQKAVKPGWVYEPVLATTSTSPA